MITRETRGRTAANVLRYVLRTGAHDDQDDTKVTDIYLLNSGLSVLGPMKASEAMQIVSEISKTRDDLKHTVLHLTFSPSRAEEGRYLEDTKDTLIQSFFAATDALGVTDRVTLLAFHQPNIPAAASTPSVHLHAVIPLPSPETGRSVSMHRIRERLNEACPFEMEIEVASDNEVKKEEVKSEAPPPPVVPFEPPRPVTPPRKKRRRVRDDFEM